MWRRKGIEIIVSERNEFSQYRSDARTAVGCRWIYRSALPSKVHPPTLLALRERGNVQFPEKSVMCPLRLFNS